MSSSINFPLGDKDSYGFYRADRGSEKTQQNANKIIEKREIPYENQRYFSLRRGKIKKLIIIDLKVANEASRNVARMVLHNPSPEAKKLVKRGLTELGELIKKYHLTAEDLNFLLEAVPDARSAFSWKHVSDQKERLERLEKWVDQLKKGEFDHFDSHFSQYVDELETMMTAIGYRGVGPCWIQNTTVPSANVSKFIKDFKDAAYIIPPPGEREFPNRSKDAVLDETHPLGFEIPQGWQDEVIGGLPGPQPGLPKREFIIDSYVAKAVKEGIPMRNHISGSAPLTLAALQFVLNKGEERREPDELSFIKLGGILCATFDIGDFHTLTETAAGVIYAYQTYMEKADFSNEYAPILEKVEAKNFLALSIGFLSSLVDDKKVEEFDLNVQELFDSIEKEHRTLIRRLRR